MPLKEPLRMNWWNDGSFLRNQQITLCLFFFPSLPQHYLNITSIALETIFRRRFPVCLGLFQVLRSDVDARLKRPDLRRLDLDLLRVASLVLASRRPARTVSKG